MESSFAKGMSSDSKNTKCYFEYFSDDTSFVCQNLTPSIQKLSLAGCRDKLTNGNVQSLVQRCNNLLELDLSDSTVLQDQAVSTIIEHLSKSLKKLALSRCFDIHVTKFLDLYEIDELKSLNVFGMMTDAKLEILKKQLSHLSINEYPLCYISRSANGERRNQLWDVRLW